jgi:hypothetical protein
MEEEDHRLEVQRHEEKKARREERRAMRELGTSTPTLAHTRARTRSGVTAGGRSVSYCLPEHGCCLPTRAHQCVRSHDHACRSCRSCEGR